MPSMPKVGVGFDSHRFVRGRKLFLGGIEIPYEMGLDGHSDADVLLHAICDAFLGALGKGDIGEHFPDSDETYRDMASIKFLERVNALAKKEGYVVNNIDAVVIAEAPNLRPFKVQMRSFIAESLGIDESVVNIKATTNEGMGFIGRKEGIAAYATLSITRKDKK